MAIEDSNALQVESLKSEFDILKLVGKNNNIVNLVGKCTKNNKIHKLVLEYCKYGNLKNFLRKWKSSAATKSLLIEYCYQIALDMEYISNHEVSEIWPIQCITLNVSENIQILHRDLATRNVLMSEVDNIKLCDFGLARKGKRIHSTSAFEKSLKWAAIESVLRGNYTTKSDVWSFGVCVWEIFSFGNDPHKDIDNKKYRKIMQDKILLLEKPTEYNMCDDRIFELMKLCWQEEAELRPSFAQLVKIFSDLKDKASQEEKQKRGNSDYEDWIDVLRRSMTEMSEVQEVKDRTATDVVP